MWVSSMLFHLLSSTPPTLGHGICGNVPSPCYEFTVSFHLLYPNLTLSYLTFSHLKTVDCHSLNGFPKPVVGPDLHFAKWCLKYNLGLPAALNAMLRASVPITRCALRASVIWGDLMLG